jgi:hypothetical protein
LVFLNLKKLLAYSISLLGGIIVLAGVVFVFMYFWEGIITRVGYPDQSLIFWYLPILILGFIGIICGIAMLMHGINRLKNYTNKGLE